MSENNTFMYYENNSDIHYEYLTLRDFLFSFYENKNPL
jgi:hypothetical protein